MLTVTVAGKGGRPRKWASDADRVRAFRARMAGADQPATVEESIESGGDNTAAWVQIRELTATVNDQRAVIQSLQRDLRSARRTVSDQERRFAWLDAENQRLRSQVAIQVASGPGDAAAETNPPVARQAVESAPALNRAQRRAAERRMR